MKQIKTFVIAVIALLGVQSINAQAKTAHVNIQEVLSKMPAVIAAQAELKKIGDVKSGEYKTMVDEYQAKIKKYDAEANTAGEAENQKRQVEVQDMAKRIGDYQEAAQKELQKKEADLMNPLNDKVLASIKKVGKLKGFQYVLNAAQLLLAEGPDLTADVKKDLGF